MSGDGTVQFRERHGGLLTALPTTDTTYMSGSFGWASYNTGWYKDLIEFEKQG